MRNVNNRKIQTAINVNDVEYLKTIHPQKLFRFIIGKNIGNDSTIKMICEKSKGRFQILMKILFQEFEGDIKYIIECSDFLLGFVVYRMTLKNNNAEKTDPSLEFDSDSFWYKMVKGDVNDAFQDIIKISRKTAFSLHDVMKENPLQPSLRKLLKRENPIRENIIFGIILILFIISSGTAIFPLFKLTFQINKVVNIPGVLRKYMNLGILWSQLMLGIEHSVNCTMLNNLSFDCIAKKLMISTPEQSYVVHNVIGDFNRELGSIAKVIAQEVIKLNKHLDSLVSDSFTKHIEQIWFMPRALFPLNFSGKKNYIDIRSILMFYLAEISTYHNHSDKNMVCNTRLTEHFGEDMYSFMNSSIEFLMAYNSFVDSIQNYIVESDEALNVALSSKQLISICVFLASSLVFDIIWNYMCLRRLFMTILENFRIQVHPTYDNIEYGLKTTDMDVCSLLYQKFIASFIIGIVFLFIVLALRHECDFFFDTMMKYNMISVRIENLSLTFIITLHSYFRSYLFDDPHFRLMFEEKSKDFQYVISTLDEAFSPLNLVNFKSDQNLPDILQYHDDNQVLHSLHDIYNTWPLSQLVDLMDSMITNTPNLYPLDPNSNFFIHLNHINIAHFKPGIDQIHELISQLAEEQSKYLMLIISVCIVLFCVYLSIIFFMLYRKFVRIKRCYNILSIYILKLDPLFLLEQKNLVDHILCAKKDDLKFINDMKELFTAADVPLIFLGTNDTIVLYSIPILKMFGKRDDQLLGHSLLTLLQDDQRRFLNNLHQRIACTLSIKGINSNDELFSAEVKITPLSSYTLLQFKMIDDILDYEELIQVHHELYDEYLCTSFPPSIFHQNNMIYQDIYQRNYSRFAFLLIMTESQTGENEINVEMIRHYFSDCIVLFNNCSLWCSIFVGENPLIEAIVCYQYFGFNDERKAGIILEGVDLSVLFYGLSEDFDWSDPDDIMDASPPHVTIEPKLDLMKYFHNINKLVIGKLILHKSDSKIFPDSNAAPIDNELVMIDNFKVSGMDFLT